MSTNVLKTSPAPILDALKGMENPHRRKVFDAGAHFTDAKIDGADIDLEYALKFLFGYNGSTATFNAYRREIERLLQWSWRVERRSAHRLAREDIEDFVRFTLAPPAAWIGERHAPRFVTRDGERRAHPHWRPFVASVSKVEAKAGRKPNARTYSPSQSAVRATFTALSSFYDFLTEESVINLNPVALIRQKSKFIRRDQNAAVVRRISNLQWDYVIETAEMMAAENPDEDERTLFIMNCLFALYLRISELVADERSAPVMGDFRKDQDGNWWFHVTGKGNKDRTITVSDAMLSALKRYREALGLPPLPAINEQTPLIAKARGVGPVTSTRQIRRIVQSCFDAAFERMKDDGLEIDAMELRAATVHWLRHTGISEDVKIRPREHVRDDAGHASMATTDRYIESDRRERHASARKKPLRDLD
ncbi:MAG: site-specific integrase [Pseudomonadota bacterium]